MNGKTPVQITVKGVQTVGGDRDQNILVTEGFLAVKPNAVYLTYNESEATGFPGHSTTLKIEDNKISLTRFGAYRTKMVIEKDAYHVCDYPTPYGTLQFTILGKEVKGSIRQKGGQLYAEYDMIQETGEPPINNKLYISVK